LFLSDEGKIHKLNNSEPDIVSYVKVKTSARAGHVVRMNNEKTLKKYLKQNHRK
jgi:hypothetical protein